MPSAQPPPPSPRPPAGQLVDAFGARCYRIDRAEAMPPFFCNVVSACDLWLFVASNGGLTAGRGDADHALFPYATVDKIIDSAGVTGPATVLRVREAGREIFWQPFAAHTTQVHEIERRLYKSAEGDRIWFEETNTALGLRFRYGWATAEAHGFIRTCELASLRPAPVHLLLADGVRNLLPPGITSRLQSDSSCLADAYKTAELLPRSTCAVYSLAAGIVDRAIPAEALRATLAWSHGLPEARILLSDAQFEEFCAGGEPAERSRVRGVRGNYLLATALTLPPQAVQRWTLVLDTGLTQPEVARRHATLAGGLPPDELEAAIRESTGRLRGIAASADGLQAGGDEIATVHHFANTLFNVMRGGLFAEGPRIPTADFTAVVRRHNAAAAVRHAAFLAALPAFLSRDELLARVTPLGDADLDRLAREYLPLTFSRRHGDPSRPWNRFQIRVRDEQGARVLAHEGNWRDIFQNWEALCVSYPDFIEAAVAKFLNASTADGYNPYRLSHAGIDWEVPNHEDPWSSIGYWGDHQVVYLLKFLEWSARCHPGRLAQGLRAARHTYANVPYRLAPYAAMRRNPRETIRFDDALHRAIVRREAAEGSDARLLADTGGRVRHVSLTEKLLVLALTRLTNFIPGAGVWMNTQRPEWNDANNALVGYGVSFVTACYLRRLLAHLRAEMLPALDPGEIALSQHVAALLREVHRRMHEHRGVLAAGAVDDTHRRAVVDALAGAGSAYREAVYREGPGDPVPVAPAELHAALDLALAFVEHTLRGGRRADGLYESYLQLEFLEDPPRLRLHSLYPMLEGQVAILSSGLLPPAQAVELLRALRASALYRADQRSYLLYPDRELPGFLERNVLPEDAVTANPLLHALLAAGDRRLVARDVAGRLRFQADLVNADALQERLRALAAEPAWAGPVAAHAAAVERLYEDVFHHRAFTGRSGSMFGYEGLGCIYWHMVAKLLLAVQENVQAAETAGAAEAATLREIYYEVRAGLGFNKAPAEYGAFPTDPYSHTPGHSGAQQPGMTGQVKEEILTRWGELGVRIEAGALAFRPTLLRRTEFTSAPAPFRFPDGSGTRVELALPAGALAFTFCGVPVVYRLTGGDARLRWEDAEGGRHELAGPALGRETSALVFGRTGRVTRIEVDLGAAFNPV